MSVFRQRRGTAAALAAANETPAAGQIIFEIDTNRIKIGDGVRSYTQLHYLDNEVVITDVAGLRSELDGIQSAVSTIQGDGRWTDQRTPTDGSVTAAKLATGLMIDGPRYQHRRGTLASLTATNPTPAAGELVFESDTNRVKIGNGTQSYTALPYLATGQQSSQATPAAILDPLTFDGTTTAFIMRSNGTAVTPATYAYLLISLNGVIQNPGVSFTIDGSLLTFASPPASTDQFFGVFIGSSAPHQHSGADIVSGTVPVERLPGTVVYTADARLTNARTPLSHKPTHATGGSDELTPADIGAATASHVHAISAVTGLQAALDSKQAAGSYAALVHSHSASDITTGTISPDRIPTSIVRTTDSRLTNSRSPTLHKSTHATGGSDAIAPADIGAATASHTHGMSEVSGLTTALSERSLTGHHHDGRYYTQSQMTTLLAGKQAAGSYAAASHTHGISEIVGLQSSLDSKVTASDVSAAITSVVGAAPAALDTLQELAAALDNNASYASAVTTALAGKAAVSHTHTAAGITDFSSAVLAASPVTSVNGQTGAVTISVFSGSYNDLTNKPTLFDGSYTSLANVPASFTPSTHQHVVGDVTGLQAALNSKQPSGSYAAAVHGHMISEVTGLEVQLSEKASSAHAHNALDIVSGEFDISRIPTGSDASSVCIGNDARLSNARTPLSHTHDASAIQSGVIATARLGTGTADATTYLRGDQTWAAIQLFIQNSNPNMTSPGLWIQTGLGESGNDITFWIEDGQP